MMGRLLKMFAGNELVGKSYSYEKKSYKVKLVDSFSYVDPIDKSIAKNQVLFLLLSRC